MNAAIANLRSVGMATVVASGNNGWLNGISFPACISGADQRRRDQGRIRRSSAADQVMPFSNSASFLSLLAPGLAHHLVGPRRWLRAPSRARRWPRPTWPARGRS